MKRIALFLATNLAILLVASVTLSLLGVPRMAYGYGVDVSLTDLLIYCAVFGFTGSIISLLISKPIAKWSAGVQLIDQPRTQGEAWLVNTVKELADKAGIGMPEVGVFPAHESNAFATGWNRNNALVAISEGMLQRFNKEEIRAVLAHEVGHVANGDMVTLTLIQGVVNTFVMFFARIIGGIVDRAISGNNDESPSTPGIAYYVTTFVMEMVLAVLASMIVMAFSRYREYRADHAGASLASRDGMISALNRLRAETEEASGLPTTLTAFGIRSGLAHRLFASHPPLEERIARLQQMR
ncbi:Probable protease htpX homolog [gamma proteobacterium HdN1]|nr:Probable protease htpX homolog [gamma proteobacterium HdN1]